MKNQSKLLIVWVITLIMVVIPVSSLYGQDVQKSIGGELTPDITWRIEGNILYISGKGVVPTTMFGARSAWHDYRSNFHSVVIEDGITGLGQNVFTGYKNITSLTIAGSVKDLAPSSFNSCKSLSVVEVKGATPSDINASVFYRLKYKNVKLIVPAGTKATYEADPFWGKFGTIEESAQSADMQPASTVTLTEPCIIHLKRNANFFGGGAKIKVFLNGVEQEKIGNGETIVMQTDRVKNELFLQWNKTALSIRRFEATAGGDIHIEYSNMIAYMKIIDEENETKDDTQ